MVEKFERVDKNVNFKKELGKGKECEQHFYDYFTARGHHCYFVDEKDVDFIVTTKKGRQLKVDVKRGANFGKHAYHKQRMVVEDIQNIRIGSDGWFRYDADDLYICLDDIINKKFYLYQMGDLREYIAEYKGYTSYVLYGELQNSLCYFVYIEKFFDWLLRHGRSHHVFSYGEK